MTKESTQIEIPRGDIYMVAYLLSSMGHKDEALHFKHAYTIGVIPTKNKETNELEVLPQYDDLFRSLCHYEFKENHTLLEYEIIKSIKENRYKQTLDLISLIKVYETVKFNHAIVAAFKQLFLNGDSIIMDKFIELGVNHELLEAFLLFSIKKKKHNLRVIRYFISKEVNVNCLLNHTISDEFELSPLYLAVKNRNLETIQLLLDHGAKSMNASYKHTYIKGSYEISLDYVSPITTCFFEDVEIFEYIFKDMITRGNFFESYDLQIIIQKHIEFNELPKLQRIIEYYHSNGRELEIPNRIFVNCCKYKHEMAKFLITNCLYLSFRLNLGNLIWATKYDIELIKLLIERGADVNDFSNRLWTSLAESVQTKDLDLVKLMIAHSSTETILKENTYGNVLNISLFNLVNGSDTIKRNAIFEFLLNYFIENRLLHKTVKIEEIFKLLIEIKDNVSICRIIRYYENLETIEKIELLIHRMIPVTDESLDTPTLALFVSNPEIITIIAEFSE